MRCSIFYKKESCWDFWEEMYPKYDITNTRKYSLDECRTHLIHLKRLLSSMDKHKFPWMQRKQVCIKIGDVRRRFRYLGGKS